MRYMTWRSSDSSTLRKKASSTIKSYEMDFTRNFQIVIRIWSFEIDMRSETPNNIVYDDVTAPYKLLLLLNFDMIDIQFE